MYYWQEHIDDGDDDNNGETPEELADRLHDELKNGDYNE